MYIVYIYISTFLTRKPNHLNCTEIIQFFLSMSLTLSFYYESYIKPNITHLILKDFFPMLFSCLNVVISGNTSLRLSFQPLILLLVNLQFESVSLVTCFTVMKFDSLRFSFRQIKDHQVLCLSSDLALLLHWHRKSEALERSGAKVEGGNGE